jgi:hypothetical protein
MSPDELEEIGTLIWGRWGWQTKLAMRLGVDGSTVRRWKAGSAVSEATALAVRALRTEFVGTGVPERRPDHRRMLAAIASAHATAALGHPVMAFLAETANGLVATVHIIGQGTFEARESDAYAGLAAIEDAIGKVRS